MASEGLMSLFTEIACYLSDLSYTEYRESKLPCPVDNKITEACELFKEAKPEERIQLSAMLQDKKVREVLVEYAIRMSMQGVRTMSQIHLINGLVALEMMPKRMDLDYDDYMALALLYHSAVKLANPVRLFNESAQYAEDEDTKAFILHFPKRQQHDQRLEAFGYHEVMGPSGLIYQYNKHPIPKGLL